jgi:hypothetical protein
VLRAWACPCGESFYATAGAERTSAAQPPYAGFSVVWNDRPFAIALKGIGKNETDWAIGAWAVGVAGPPSGPGTRVITMTGGTTGETGGDHRTIGEWRLEPGWGPAEVARRIKAHPPAVEVDAEFLAQVFVRLLS